MRPPEATVSGSENPGAEPTIFAVATGAGLAAIAVMRISGPAAAAMLTALCGALPPPRRATLRRLRDAGGEVLDRALVLWLPGPASYTGEDSAELHLHAGVAVVDGVADALASLGGRPAEAGEFTRRAFLNGRMDLLEAEAVSDLAAAETSAQRVQALRQLDGALGTIYRNWAERLQYLLAEQEALIDFPDEDMPDTVDAALRVALPILRTEIAAHLSDERRGERLRNGLVFAVTGPPNVGKSSLVNALAAREVAIVAPTPGTTRDTLEARLDFGGVPVTLVDTAGLRETNDAVEAEGVRRARARVADADLVLSVFDAREPRCGLRSGAAGGADVVRIANKLDLAEAGPPDSAIGVSARTGEGLDQLRERLNAAARALTGAGGPPPLTRARHRAALREATERLESAESALLPELRAEDLRLALRSIGRITGTVDVEDLLGTIFGRFCIGK